LILKLSVLPGRDGMVISDPERSLTGKRTDDDALDIYAVIFDRKDDVQLFKDDPVGVVAESGPDMLAGTCNAGIDEKSPHGCVQIPDVPGGRTGYFQFLPDVLLQSGDVAYCFGRKDDPFIHNVRKSMP
jgi:hypothetical protein